jgi:phosphosulfolactate phosphohydrolase-like enzyme
MVGAGYFVDLFSRSMHGNRDFSDAAVAAQQLYLSGDPLDLLMRSRVGKMMQDRDLVHEVEFAAQRSQIDMVPVLENGRLVAIK